MFKELMNVIKNHNEQYELLNLSVNDMETALDGSTEAQQKLDEAKFNRWQFIHDYATVISDFIIQHVADLTTIDLSPLDLVPYTVWNKIPKKTIVIIDALHNM